MTRCKRHLGLDPARLGLRIQPGNLVRLVASPVIRASSSHARFLSCRTGTPTLPASQTGCDRAALLTSADTAVVRWPDTARRTSMPCPKHQICFSGGQFESRSRARCQRHARSPGRSFQTLAQRRGRNQPSTPATSPAECGTTSSHFPRAAASSKYSASSGRTRDGSSPSTTANSLRPVTPPSSTPSHCSAHRTGVGMRPNSTHAIGSSPNSDGGHRRTKSLLATSKSDPVVKMDRRTHPRKNRLERALSDNSKKG